MDSESAAVLLERRFRRPTFIPRGLKDPDQRMALRLGRIQERDLLNDLLEDHQPRASRERRDFTKHRLECVAVARFEGTKLVEAGDQKVVIGHTQRVPRQSRIGRGGALSAFPPQHAPTTAPPIMERSSTACRCVARLTNTAMWRLLGLALLVGMGLAAFVVGGLILVGASVCDTNCPSDSRLVI